MVDITNSISYDIRKIWKEVDKRDNDTEGGEGK